MTRMLAACGRRGLVVAVVLLAVVVGQLILRRPAPPAQVDGIAPAAAQVEAAQSRFQDALGSQGIPAGDVLAPTDGIYELHVAIKQGDGSGEAKAAPPPPAATSLAVTGRQVRQVALPQQRSVDVSADQLLVVAVGPGGRARWATTVPDPTLVRAEFPDANGLLSGQVLHLPLADLLVRVPASPEITQVDIYRPAEPGGNARPQLLGSIQLG
jgi:hypothetical protein